MAEWSSAVVVRPNADADQQMSSLTLRSNASHINNVVVTVSNGPSFAAGGGAGAGVVQPYNSSQRALITTRSSNAPSIPFYSALVDANASKDPAPTFWVPDPSRGEVGLLETLHRRADNHMMHLLVSSRPSEELRRNFSTRNGDCVCLDDDLFKLSKTHFALQTLERVDDSVMVDGHALKSALRENLPQLHQDDYYLVSYRDYSAWATSSSSGNPYRASIKRDSTLGPNYVSQYFAIRTGQNPAAFIPITEGQFLCGAEILEHQRHTATPAQIASKAVNLYALNTDQFRSLMSVGAGTTDAHRGGNAAAGAPQTAAAYVPPSPWDWTPAAIEKRVNHFLDMQYRAVGRLVVKGLLVGFCTYLFIQYVRRGTGLSDSPSHPPSAPARRGGRPQSRGGRGQYPDDHYQSGGSAVGNIVRSIFVTGPKDVFDFLLGSTS